MRLPIAKKSATERLMPNEVNVLRDAARRLPLDKLPRLAKPSKRFGWVLLPQVQIERAERAAVATVRLVEADERVEVLARMMGGLDSSDSGLAHARELLASART